MSIVGPKDTITITIDGLTGQADMKLSRDMPYPFLITVLAQMMTSLSNDQMQRLTGGDPAKNVTKSAETPGGDQNHRIKGGAN